VVADHGAADLEDRRREQLRTALAPAARLAASMGMDQREAIDLFRELLDENQEES
jgi:DNA-binding transcriptional regulator YhcF (GntR family)